MKTKTRYTLIFSSLATILVGASTSDKYVSDEITSNETWSINLSKKNRFLTPKKEIVVAVIDTGVYKNHDFLKDSLVKMPKEYTDYHFNDTHGHGTHISGIIKGIFPYVKILPIRYTQKAPKTKIEMKNSLDDMVVAIEKAVSLNVDIINISAGGGAIVHEEYQALQKAKDKGILVVTAAGNHGENVSIKGRSYYPGSYNLENILNVNAVNRAGNLVRSSNFSYRDVDISAPGKSILSSYISNSRTRLTGTSQATAFVTGVAALIKSQYPHFSYKELKRAIIYSASPSSRLLKRNFAQGTLHADKAIIYASKLNINPNYLSDREKKENRKESTEDDEKLFSLKSLSIINFQNLTL